MSLIRKANVVLEIKDTEVDRYLNMGYLLVDENGNILKEGTPQDLESFKRAYFEQKKEIEQLKAEIKALKGESSDDEPADVPKKKITRKKKQEEVEEDD